KGGAHGASRRSPGVSAGRHPRHPVHGRPSALLPLYRTRSEEGRGGGPWGNAVRQAKRRVDRGRMTKPFIQAAGEPVAQSFDPQPAPSGTFPRREASMVDIETPSASHTAEANSGLPQPRRVIAIASVLSAMALVVLDAAIANVALPTIA